jgi:F0F1-type ATP synthase assembly protein I
VRGVSLGKQIIAGVVVGVVVTLVVQHLTKGRER